MTTATAPWPAPMTVLVPTILPPPDPRTRVPDLLDEARHIIAHPLAPSLSARQPRTERDPSGFLLVGIIATLMFLAAFIGFFAGRASALPLCGGNQNVQTAPVNCTNQRTIDGTLITTVLDVKADGSATASYTLGAPRAVDTPIRVRAHRGISSSPLTHEVAGVIPAGSTSGSLGFTINCGQIDVKAVFTDNGDARGRVSAPFVTKAGNCQETTPSTTTTTTIVTTTTTGGSTTTAATTTTVPGEATSTTPPATGPAGTLPGTGAHGDHLERGALVAVLLVLVGAGIVLAARFRPERS